MDKLVYTREELMADDPYAGEHREVGYLLHGGFNEAGDYISPKTLNRWPAIRAWQKALQNKGWDLVEATGDLLRRGNYPNLAQQKLLINGGFGESFWNSLTVTGIIEARGQILCTVEAPDFQDVIVEDISETATGHLNKGLLYAHGADEGGDPDKPEYGAHDAMWFASRDLVFGKDAYPLVEPPESIGRPEQGRQMPQLPEGHEGILSLLMNVLMIEVRAEAFFAHSVALMRDREIFSNAAEADQAATMVERIRIDESVHVGYLQTVISEMRSFTFKTVDGGTIAGKDMIDPIWDKMVVWHGETTYDLSKEQSYEAIKERLLSKENGQKLLADFDALDTYSEKAA
jgi:hypothetical protein